MTSKFLGIVAGAAIASVSSAAMLNVTHVGGSSHNPDGAGGTSNTTTGYFKVKFTDLTGVSESGGDLVVNNEIFTFCVEIGETLANGSHVFDVSNRSILGGASSTEPQPLVSHTAFLYTMFRAGALNTITGISGWDTGDNTDLNDFQDALWYFQNQLGNTDTSGYTDNAQDFIAAANDAVDNGAYGWAGGLGRVRVLNVGGATTGGDGTIYPFGASQDVLVLVPLPQGVGLATVGLLALGVRRRRAL